MRSLNFHDMHMPKGPNLFLVSVGGLACFMLALVVFAVAAFGGGDAYAEQLGGEVTLTVLIVGTVVSLAELLTSHDE